MVIHTSDEHVVRPQKQSIISQIFDFVINNKALTLGIFLFMSILFMAIFADYIAPYSFEERSSNCGEDNPYCNYDPPSSEHYFGTNQLGRDVFSRVIYGSRTTIQLAFTASIFSLVVGIPLGVFSGYFGGKIDRVLNGIADALYSFPSLLLAITLSIILAQYGGLKVLLSVSISTSIIYIPLYMKVTRAQVLQIKSESFIDAAKSIGANNRTIIGRYILPNVLAASIALIPFNMIEAILVNAGLAFLGLGYTPPTADWGYDVFKHKDLVIVRTFPWTIFFPALAIFLLAFSFALIGDALNDKLNPVLREDDE